MGTQRQQLDLTAHSSVLLSVGPLCPTVCWTALSYCLLDRSVLLSVGPLLVCAVSGVVWILLCLTMTPITLLLTTLLLHVTLAVPAALPEEQASGQTDKPTDNKATKNVSASFNSFNDPFFGSSHGSFGSSVGSGIFDECGCEDDIYDSCNNVDEPCCAPLICQNNRCVPACTPLNTPCVPYLNSCCGYLNQACQQNPLTPGAGVCVQCPVQGGFCNTLAQQGNLGSCCFGFQCQSANNPLNPALGVCIALPVTPGGPIVG